MKRVRHFAPLDNVPDGGSVRTACGVTTTTQHASSIGRKVTCKRCRHVLGIGSSWAQRRIAKLAVARRNEKL